MKTKMRAERKVKRFLMNRQRLNEVHSVTEPELREDGKWEFIVRYHNGVDDKQIRDTREEAYDSYRSYRLRTVAY